MRGLSCLPFRAWPGQAGLAGPASCAGAERAGGPWRPQAHAGYPGIDCRPATVRGCRDVMMPTLERAQPAARSSCWGCFLPCLRLSSAWPHIPSSPSTPRSGAIAFPRFEFALDQAARALDPGHWALGTGPWALGYLCRLCLCLSRPCAHCPVPCGRARPHGPETLNTGQGNIQSLNVADRALFIRWWCLEVSGDT